MLGLEARTHEGSGRTVDGRMFGVYKDKVHTRVFNLPHPLGRGGHNQGSVNSAVVFKGLLQLKLILKQAPLFYK